MIPYRNECECDESRKKRLDGARLKPKRCENGESAAKPEKEGSTTKRYVL